MSHVRDEDRLQLLRAGYTSDVPLLPRRGWIRETIQRLEEAKRLSVHQLFVVRWLAGVVYAQLPSLCNQRDAACTDLSWCVEQAIRSRPCATALRLAAGRTGGLGRHAWWHASAQGAAGLATGNAGAGRREQAVCISYPPPDDALAWVLWRAVPEVRMGPRHRNEAVARPRQPLCRS